MHVHGSVGVLSGRPFVADADAPGFVGRRFVLGRGRAGRGGQGGSGLLPGGGGRALLRRRDGPGFPDRPGRARGGLSYSGGSTARGFSAGAFNTGGLSRWRSTAQINSTCTVLPSAE